MQQLAKVLLTFVLDEHCGCVEGIFLLLLNTNSIECIKRVIDMLLLDMFSHIFYDLNIRIIE